MKIHTYRKKKFRIISKTRFTIFISLTLILMIFATTTVLGANISHSLTKETYTAVEVSLGDTLWDLAEKFGPKNQDLRAVVHAIRTKNHIESSSSIQPGQIVLIPTYL